LTYSVICNHHRIALAAEEERERSDDYEKGLHHRWLHEFKWHGSFSKKIAR